MLHGGWLVHSCLSDLFLFVLSTRRLSKRWIFFFLHSINQTGGRRWHAAASEELDYLFYRPWAGVAGGIECSSNMDEDEEKCNHKDACLVLSLLVHARAGWYMNMVHGMEGGATQDK
jgi:hypothetical protein